MATPANAPYKLAQRKAEGASKARRLFQSTSESFFTKGERRTARASRDGKLNKKSGRCRTTEYTNFSPPQNGGPSMMPPRMSRKGKLISGSLPRLTGF